MANPLYGQFGAQQTGNNELSNFMSEVQRLRQTIKNPKQEVERLLQSGKMSQQQFNQFSQMANQLMGSARR